MSAHKSTAKKSAKKGMAATKAKPPLKPGPDGVVRLAGGNPQIAKGYGDGPVQAYIKAMPGWQSALGKRLDAIITKAVPGVRKAVKWNSPFYGVEDDLWFVNFHVYARYVKVAFFRGSDLRPKPPGESKQKNVRYLDIHEAQFTTWVKQAAALPGEKL
jgi:hypothetical protein